MTCAVPSLPAFQRVSVSTPSRSKKSKLSIDKSTETDNGYVSLDGRVTNRSSEEGLQLHDCLSRPDEVGWTPQVKAQGHAPRAVGTMLASPNKVMYRLSPGEGGGRTRLTPAVSPQEPPSDEASSEEDPEASYSTLRRGVERLNSDCLLRNRKNSHYKKHYTVEVRPRPSRPPQGVTERVSPSSSPIRT